MNFFYKSINYKIKAKKYFLHFVARDKFIRGVGNAAHKFINNYNLHEHSQRIKI